MGLADKTHYKACSAWLVPSRPGVLKDVRPRYSSLDGEGIMRVLNWLFFRRHSDSVMDDQMYERRPAQYCQLPGGKWALKRELTLPISTEPLFLTVPLPKSSKLITPWQHRHASKTRHS
jgi:hypothetical protein